MASAATFPKLRLGPKCHSNFQFQVIDPIHIHIKICDAWKCHMPTQGLLISSGRSLRHPFLPVSAVGSGWDSSIAEGEKKSELSLEKVKTSVVSRDDENINVIFLCGFWLRAWANLQTSAQKEYMVDGSLRLEFVAKQVLNFHGWRLSHRIDNEQVRVDLPGKATQKVFDEALTSLARDAPPVPGFRKSKGGRTSNIPSSILLQMLGKSRVTKFVLQEILSVTVGDFVKKENLKVNPEIKTSQSEGELESSFTPGSAFGFNAILQLDKTSDSDEASEESSL